MLDNRYPFMMRIDDSEIPSHRQSYYRKVAESVHARTGLSCCYRKPSGDLYFYLNDPSRGVWGETIRFDGRVDRWANVDVEKLVKLLVQWKASPETKRRWTEEAERLDKERCEREKQAFLDERRPEALDMMRKIRTNRRTVVKTGRLGQKAVA